MPGAEAGATPISCRPVSGQKRWSRRSPRLFSSSQERRRAARELARFLETAPGGPRAARERAARAVSVRPSGCPRRPLLTTPSSRRSSRGWPSAPRTSSRRRWSGGWRRTSPAFYALLLLWHVAGLEGDRVLLARRTRPDGAGLRLAAEPRRSAARHGAHRPLHAGRAGRTGRWRARCRAAMAAVPSFTRFVYLPLLAAIVAFGPAAPLGGGPGTSGAKVNLGPGSADRGHPAAAGALPGRLLRPALGAVTSDHGDGVPQSNGAVVAGIPQAGLRAAGGGGRRRGAADVLPPEGPRARAVPVVSCSWRSTPSPAAAGRWRSSASPRWSPASTWATAGRCRARWPGASRCGAPPGTTPSAGGDQVSQSLWALATGGVFGTGLGLGETRFIPAGHTDLILAAAGEELGLVGLLAIAVDLRHDGVARLPRRAASASDDHGFFLGTALTCFSWCRCW